MKPALAILCLALLTGCASRRYVRQEIIMAKFDMINFYADQQEIYSRNQDDELQRFMNHLQPSEIGMKARKKTK